MGPLWVVGAGSALAVLLAKVAEAADAPPQGHVALALGDRDLGRVRNVRVGFEPGPNLVDDLGVAHFTLRLPVENPGRLLTAPTDPLNRWGEPSSRKLHDRQARRARRGDRATTIPALGQAARPLRRDHAKRATSEVRSIVARLIQAVLGCVRLTDLNKPAP